jgi:DNA-binding response OmpR family regulator
MLTALMDTEVVLRSYEFGADYYLGKPLSAEELLKAINFVKKMKNRKI